MKDAFLLLDSSYLYRSNADVSALSYKKARKNPESFIKKVNRLIQASNKDNEYYFNIKKLQKAGFIKELITYETMNKYAIEDTTLSLKLFGTIPTDLNLFIANRAEYTWTLWNEEIAPSIFYKAALIIHNSQNIVIDENFTKLSVGKQLLKYVSSASKTTILGNNHSYDLNINTLILKNVSPAEYINQLFTQIN